MLSIKENLLETMKKDGHPDRFVKGFEFVDLRPETCYYMADYPIMPMDHDQLGYDQYGVLWSLPVGQMGAYPLHDDEHTLVQDITEWRKVVKRPMLPPVDGYWDMLKGKAAMTDRDQQFVCALHPQGVFERLHALMGMEDCFINFYEEPEEMEALIDYIVDIELEFADAMIRRVGIDAILHHDDWGTTNNSFLSPEMFEEFLLPAYKKIYGFYKENGVLIIHHNDGYGANLVDFMIEMGIDIWQGVIPDNDIPALLEKTDGKLTFMGEIESRRIDIPSSTPEEVAEEVARACRKIGAHRNFIPCLTAGMPFSMVPGVLEDVNRNIDKMSAELF